jgi:hypothetical protein
LRWLRPMVPAHRTPIARRGAARVWLLGLGSYRRRCCRLAYVGDLRPMSGRLEIVVYAALAVMAYGLAVVPHVVEYGWAVGRQWEL